MQTVQLEIADDNMVQNIKLQSDTHYEKTKAYFCHALREIENTNDIPLSQEEYHAQMDRFINTL